MQLFINNWSAVLLAPITDIATELSVDPDRAAELVGLGTGNFYELTLVEVDAAGVEINWEIVTVKGRAGGVLTVAPRTGFGWPLGAKLNARLTSAALARMLAAIQLLQARVTALEPPASAISLTSVLYDNDVSNFHGFSQDINFGAIDPVGASAVPGADPVVLALGELLELYWDDDAAEGEYVLIRFRWDNPAQLPFARMVIDGSAEFLVAAADGLRGDSGNSVAWWNTSINPLPAGPHTVQFFAESGAN